MAEPLDDTSQRIRELVTPPKACPWCCQERGQSFPAQATTWLCERHRLALHPTAPRTRSS